MSSTNRGGKRIPFDKYQTPKWVIDRLIDRIGSLLPTEGKWLEPSAGSGNIIRSVNAKLSGVKWTAVEYTQDYSLCSSGASKIIYGDFLTTRLNPVYSVAITNPPYSLANQFINKCFTLADITIMLLRLNYVASAKRYQLMSTYPPDIYVVPNRPSFTENRKADSTEYAWFVWNTKTARRPYGKVQMLDITPKNERKQ